MDVLQWNPYSALTPMPSLAMKSADIADGQRLAPAQYGAGVGGEDISPQLSWQQGPAGTQSYAVTVYDPDAPTASGYWHWAVFDIPRSVLSLPTNAGSPAAGLLPPGAITLPNEERTRKFIGAAPPDREHRYFVVVHAVDQAHLDIDPDSTPAILGFNLNFHGLARGIIVAKAVPGGAQQG